MENPYSAPQTPLMVAHEVARQEPSTDNKRYADLETAALTTLFRESRTIRTLAQLGVLLAVLITIFAVIGLPYLNIESIGITRIWLMVLVCALMINLHVLYQRPRSGNYFGIVVYGILGLSLGTMFACETWSYLNTSFTRLIMHVIVFSVLTLVTFGFTYYCVALLVRHRDLFGPDGWIHDRLSAEVERRRLNDS